jgi:hypothetical protein
LFADKCKVYKVSIPRLIHFRDNPRLSLKAGNFAYKNRQIGEDHLDWLARFDKDAYVTFKFNEAKIVSNHIEIIPITNNPEIAPGPYNNPELVPGPTGME